VAGGERAGQAGRPDPQHVRRVGHATHEGGQVVVLLGVGHDVDVPPHGRGDAGRVSEVGAREQGHGTGAGHLEEPPHVGLSHGPARVVAERRRVDRAAVDVLDAAAGGAPAGRERRCHDRRTATAALERGADLRRDRPAQGGIELLEDERRPHQRARHRPYARGRLFGAEHARVRVGHHDVEVGRRRQRRAGEGDRGAMPCARELHAGVRGAGQVVGDHGHAHRSGSRRLRGGAAGTVRAPYERPTISRAVRTARRHEQDRRPAR
jgi:hypothetical protein